MMRTMAKVFVTAAVAAILGGCAAHGGGGKPDMWTANTYVMVFTVPESAFTVSNPHCSGNCVPVGFGEDVFFIEDLGYTDDQRKFPQKMYSPRWHQPDLATARKWARCLVEALDKEQPGFGKIEVTSAYLIRVRAPEVHGRKLEGATATNNPCDLPRTKKR
jgi:hypothetical protein